MNHRRRCHVIMFGHGPDHVGLRYNTGEIVSFPYQQRPDTLVVHLSGSLFDRRVLGH